MMWNFSFKLSSISKDVTRLSRKTWTNAFSSSLPSLVTLYPETSPPENPIFIFAANFLMTQVGDVRPMNLRLNDFVQNVLLFDHPDTSLACMTREIGNYFTADEQGFILYHQSDQARQYRDWSRRMCRRHAVLIRKHDA